MQNVAWKQASEPRVCPAAETLCSLQGYIHKPGKIGIVSRSGTLTYEVGTAALAPVLPGAVAS
jgi:succinyl-CoA synthetase alpha subunit